MAKEFAGEIKLDVRDSTPDWNAYLAPALQQQGSLTPEEFATQKAKILN